MRDLYLNTIVDITDPYCEFIAEFNKEINKYGAIVYNYDSNSYQFIRRFDHIDFKKELLPDFIKIEATDALLNALQITIHYEFNPEEETDEENLEIWNDDISKIQLPLYKYDDDGEIYVDKTSPITINPSKHVVWFLKKESFDYILDTDLLLLSPVIKNVNIARELIKKYACHPFEFVFDKNDADYVVPEFEGIYDLRENIEEDDLNFGYTNDYPNEDSEQPKTHCHCSKDCCDGDDCDGNKDE